jgi:oligopeptide transport system substrate-binding protein
MLELKPDPTQEIASKISQLFLHHSFYEVYDKLKKWISRFPVHIDNGVIGDLVLFYSLTSKNYLDHRTPLHLYRIILSAYLLQKKLLRLTTFSSHIRHLEMRWIPTNLIFPFSSKPVFGCLIGFNLMDRYEVFDEENVLLVLKKHLPELRLVKESTYWHRSQNQNLKIFYLELEKQDGASFTLAEQRLIKRQLEKKVKNSIQKLSPAVFMRRNEEEVYKNILALSQEIHSVQDLPQAVITLDQQTTEEIVFLITLVYIAPPQPFFLGERFCSDNFISERVSTVRYLNSHPVEAHVFRLHLDRDLSILRSDGSLDFYNARQKVVALMTEAIGEFRDYNGGILIKQQELLKRLKEHFPETAYSDLELMETFFYALIPLEKQVLLKPEVLSTLFAYFLEVRKAKIPDNMSILLKTHEDSQEAYFVIKARDISLKKTLSSLFQETCFRTSDVAYNIIDIADGVFFNCVVSHQKEAQVLIERLKEFLGNWQKEIEDQQILRIGLEYTVVSLDPRIGGDTVSNNVIRLLFEGLTRFGRNGKVENGIAESITVSSDCKQYTFKLRQSHWNDGTPISAFDFEYAWKKILSPDFKTSFAYLFYPIVNAKEAKAGKISMDQVGIKVIDEKTLTVDLNHPAPYFLDLTANTLYSPVQRMMDQQHPQWPYQVEKNYPCNGPFQLKVNQPSQGYKLVKNPHYWDAKNINLDQIIFTQTNPRQALQAFQRKEIDWMGNPMGAWYPFYHPGKEEKMISSTNGMLCWFVFNTLKPPFHHAKFRKAFALSLRRAAFLEGIHTQLMEPAYSPLFPNHSYGYRIPEGDIQEARQLMQEALDEQGLKKSDLPALTLIYHHRGIREHIAGLIQRQMKEALDIQVELKSIPWSQVFYKLTHGDFEMGLIQWISWIDDPIYTLNSFRSINEDVNFSKWEHPTFQHLLGLSDQELDPVKRTSYLAQAEKILCEEMPILPLFYQPYQALTKKNLDVVYQASLGSFDLAKCFYKKEHSHGNNFST